MADKNTIISALQAQANVIKTERKQHANTAERIGSMLLAIIDALGLSDVDELAKYFIRKDNVDATAFLLKLLAGVEVGEYVDSITAGKGAAIDSDGNAQLQSLEVRSSLKVLEVIMNCLSAVEGDFEFTESGTIIIKAERKQHANTAERIGSMLLAIIDALGLSDVDELAKYFIRKDNVDATAFLLKLLAGVEVGEYVDSITAGKGAAIDSDGNAQLQSLEVRSSLKVLEVIMNRLSAVEGDFEFTESGTIGKASELCPFWPNRICPLWL